VLDFMSGQQLADMFVCSILMAEIRYGIELTVSEEQRRAHVEWLERVVRPMFAGRVFEITEDSMLHWRLLVREGRRIGRTYPEPDLLMASVAVANGATIVTRNARDFAETGVPVLNPWST
jgi:toxin FitB